MYGVVIKSVERLVAGIGEWKGLLPVLLLRILLVSLLCEVSLRLYKWVTRLDI